MSRWLEFSVSAVSEAAHLVAELRRLLFPHGMMDSPAIGLPRRAS